MNSEEGWQMWNVRLKKLRLPKVSFSEGILAKSRSVRELVLPDWLSDKTVCCSLWTVTLNFEGNWTFMGSSAQCLRISIDFQLLPVCSYNVTKTLVFSILRWYVSIEEAFPLSITCLVKHPKYCSAGPVLVGCLSFPLCNLGLDYGV